MKTRQKRNPVTSSHVDQVIDLLLLGHSNIVIANKVGISKSICSRISTYFLGRVTDPDLSKKVISYMDKKYGLPRKEKPSPPNNRLIKEHPPYYETKLFFGLITIRSFPKFK